MQLWNAVEVDAKQNENTYIRIFVRTHTHIQCTWMDAHLFGHARRLWPNTCDGHVCTKIAHAVHVLKIANAIASLRIESNRVEFALAT